ncbi:MAG TPA: CCA tRNA nucleotidyltransferase [Planctomycetota bacterium]|jgi:tRNA nucleotidyltransferase/poly(A) polymerase|nr:CCA tRNA nucleotidyltransferase [Planctomycetota bacterium]
MQDLSGELAEAARTIASTVARAGKRAWIVGGAPRDLAIGRAPKEIDMASAASPDEIEQLFAGTIPVGRAFGTVLVRCGGLEVQHTSFRADGAYRDARHPESVRFGSTVAEDASRRDFTCNAVYLDPLDGSVEDPEQGLADLDRGVLRCVGDAEVRFREDGLRLLRLARFAGRLGLEPDAATLAGARRSMDALAGVSPERVLDELSRILEGEGARRALDLLAELEILGRVLPGATTRAFAGLPDPPGTALGLAALLSEDPAGLEALRPSRALRQRVGEILAVARAAAAAIAGPRAARIRWMRAPAFDEGVALARARGLELDAAVRERSALGHAGLFPAPLVTSADLGQAAVPKGPLWSELLREAEELQLDGRLDSRAGALAWLAARAQEGGKTPRSA